MLSFEKKKESRRRHEKYYLKVEIKDYSIKINGFLMDFWWISAR